MTGTVGAGKTSLAVEMARVLESYGHTVAVIDLDWLGWIGGPKVSSHGVRRLIRENLEAVWANMRKRRPTHVILSRFVADRDEVEGLRSALGDIPLRVVRVHASPGTIADRLRYRDSGAELAEHLSQVEAMARLLAEASLAEIDVNNEGSIDRTARHALEKLEWRETH